jgi:arylsulfatase
MTSRYPDELGVEWNMSVLSPEVETLAAWMARHGWRTGAVVSNVVLRRESGIAAGFQRYDARFPQRESVRRSPERSASDATRAALALLDELSASRKDPIFLWVHYQDPHGPYTPPAPYDSRFLAGEAAGLGAQLRLNRTQSGIGGIPNYQDLDGRRDAGFYRARYKGEVAYTDEQIGRLLHGISERGLMEGAVVVFSADHGEAMGEDDYWFAHGERVSDPLVRVPLLVRVPGRAAARRTDVASLLDVFPTLVALCGGAASEGRRGRDLLAADAASGSSSVFQSTLRVARVPQRALIWRAYRYLVEDRPQGPQEWLSAAVAHAADPPPTALEALRAEMQRLRAGLRPLGPRQAQELSAEQTEALRSLGYVGGRAPE